jgi:hypothetical protein
VFLTDRKECYTSTFIILFSYSVMQNKSIEKKEERKNTPPFGYLAV